MLSRARSHFVTLTVLLIASLTGCASNDTSPKKNVHAALPVAKPARAVQLSGVGTIQQLVYTGISDTVAYTRRSEYKPVIGILDFMKSRPLEIPRPALSAITDTRDGAILLKAPSGEFVLDARTTPLRVRPISAQISALISACRGLAIEPHGRSVRIVQVDICGHARDRFIGTLQNFSPARFLSRGNAVWAVNNLSDAVARVGRTTTQYWRIPNLGGPPTGSFMNPGLAQGIDADTKCFYYTASGGAGEICAGEPTHRIHVAGTMGNVFALKREGVVMSVISDQGSEIALMSFRQHSARLLILDAPVPVDASDGKHLWLTPINPNVIQEFDLPTSWTS